MQVIDREVPAHLEELYAPAQIAAKLRELAPRLDDWAAASLTATGHPLLCICLLRGGVFAFSDLLQEMTQSVEPAFVKASSYAITGNNIHDAGIRIDWMGLQGAGRDIVLVDNICDSGRTLRACSEKLQEAGARIVRSVVLVRRLREDSEHVPTLAGFDYPGTEWLAGYGMRDRNALMNYPAIYRVRPTSES